MVVEAVCCELVSGVIFPVYREFTGNSCESPGFPTELAPDSGILSNAWRQIPCAQEQGINPPHQGCFRHYVANAGGKLTVCSDLPLAWGISRWRSLFVFRVKLPLLRSKVPPPPESGSLLKGTFASGSKRLITSAAFAPRLRHFHRTPNLPALFWGK